MTASLVQNLLQSGDATSHNVPAGSTLFCFGDACENYVIVKTGSVRVELLTTTGHQLLLYRIAPGESCVMTTSCLLGNTVYDAQAITESDVELTLIPKATFKMLTKESPEFVEFVFQNFSARLAALVARTTELTTQTIDQRLASALLAQIENSATGFDGGTDTEQPISLTHQQLAIDIGSAREVVSRRLAHFEKQALVQRQRGQILLKDIEALKRLLQSG